MNVKALPTDAHQSLPMTNRSQTIPYFQQLQKQFAGHIRDPKNAPYAPMDEVPIEARRLEVYEMLFFNNVEGFFSQIFPICAEILGETRWLQVMREYMIKHHARTPLFHELGEEFLAFLESEWTPLACDPRFLLELAHYEWVELALSVSPERRLDANSKGEATVDIDAAYVLSPLAWPLAYEWPVHQLSIDFQPTEKSQDVTTLLVYRRESAYEDVIDFMTLTPLLYQWLTILEDSTSARTAFEAVAAPYQIPLEQLNGFAEQTLTELVSLGILKAI